MFEAVTQEEIWYTLQEIQGLSVLEKIIFGAFLELTLLSRNLQDGVKSSENILLSPMDLSLSLLKLEMK